MQPIWNNLRDKIISKGHFVQVILFKMSYIILECRYLFFRLREKISSKNDVLTKEREWKSIHQKFEYLYHIRTNIRWNDKEFYQQWSQIFGELLGLAPSSFDSSKQMLDLGCGSRPAFDWFTTSSASKYYLDPLLQSFQKIPQVERYWKGKQSKSLLCYPAEITIKELLDNCDFILCWNVLDHTFDWYAILKNIVLYSREGGIVCIGTDFKSHGIGHPGIDSKDLFYEVVQKYFTVEMEIANYTNREVAFKLKRNSIKLIS